MTILRAVLFTIFALSCVTDLAAMENEPSIHALPEYYAKLVTQNSNGSTVYYENMRDIMIIMILNSNFPHFYKKHNSIENVRNAREVDVVQPKVCSLPELTNIYKDMVKSLLANWIYVEDYRLHPEEDYYKKWAVFYKYGGCLDSEVQLIYALANKLGFEQKSFCDRTYIDYENNNTHMKFFEVKRDILDRFKLVFDWKGNGGS